MVIGYRYCADALLLDVDLLAIHIPWVFLAQDAFVRLCERTYTETDKESNKVAVGWYSKEDMRSSLKWNQSLA